MDVPRAPDRHRPTPARRSCMVGFLTIASCGFLASCRGIDGDAAVFSVPEPSDWVECGSQLVAGGDGEWDLYLWGGFALAAAKLGDRYLLYYQGSSGYDEDEGTVTWRSIGLATSSDGVSLTKYPGNPVLTWFPRGNFEEGAASLGLHVDRGTDAVHIYYGANTWMTRDEVNADGRYALTWDGTTIIERGVALNHRDPGLWGAGDEMFPVAAFHEARRQVVYYIPNGAPESGTLGVAWGAGAPFVRSREVRDKAGAVAVWGPASAARLSAGRYALFLSNQRGDGGPYVEARTVRARRPHRVSPPVARYRLEDTMVATVLLDETRGRWLMYYRNATSDAIGVRVAPAAGQDATSPEVRFGCPDR